MHPDEVTAEWLTHALRSGGVITDASVKSVRKDILGEGKGFLSSVLRVAITYDREEEGAPSSVVVKIEPEEGEFHDFGDELNAFEREIRFYRDVARNVPVRLAAIYYTVDEPPAYSMVMEDLSSFVPGDQVAGIHTAQVMDTVEIIAKIQAVYWNNGALRQLDWMPESNEVSNDYGEKWGSFVKHFGEGLDHAGLMVGERLITYIDWKKKEIARRPKTIVHSDLREDNLLFAPTGSDAPVLILDWQIAVRSIGAFDVARLVSGSELPKERTGHQFEVLGKWHDTLVQQGVRDYPWEDAVYDFRLGALAFLCYPVHFHVGLIGAEGRTKKLAEAIFTRAFSSVAEIDAASVLPG